MTQFDVYANPDPESRTVYPYVVNMQSDVTIGGTDRIVAPLAHRGQLPGGAGRLTPLVTIDNREYLVATSGLTTLPSRDLKKRIANLAAHRSEMLGAVDLLFFGV
jgi:toxin CcdB